MHQGAFQALDFSMLQFPDYPLLVGSEPGSFARDTITRRLPKIIANVISATRAKMAPDGVLQALQGLQAELEAGDVEVRPIEPFHDGSDRAGMVDTTNAALQVLAPSSALLL